MNMMKIPIQNRLLKMADENFKYIRYSTVIFFGAYHLLSVNHPVNVI